MPSGNLVNRGKDEDGSDVAGGAGYSSGVATVILKSANLLVRSSVYDCRREACALGESCTAAVIAQFDSRGGHRGGGQNNEANAAVVEFLNLQLRDTIQWCRVTHVSDLVFHRSVFDLG